MGVIKQAIGAIAILCCAGTSVAQSDELRIGGTGSAYVLMQRLSAAFRTANPGDRVEIIPGLGSGGGIAALLEGVLDLSTSGRVLNSAERAKGLASFPLLETPFAFVTSGPAGLSLRKNDVVAIYGGELTKWPDGEAIKPVLRPKSDAVTLFMLANFAGMSAAMDKLRERPDVPVAPTDQDSVMAAEKIPNSFAPMTLLQYVAERPQLRLIALDGVVPSLQSMEDGTFSLKTTIHVVKTPQPSAVALRFMAFLGSTAAEAIIRENGGQPILISRGAIH